MPNQEEAAGQSLDTLDKLNPLCGFLKEMKEVAGEGEVCGSPVTNLEKWKLMYGRTTLSRCWKT